MKGAGACLDTLEQRLRNRTPKSLQKGSLRPVGVLVPVFIKEGELYLLLTKRSEGVQRHQGQIAFPGGCWEPGDSDLLQTALRECEEEIGLDRSSVHLIGALDHHETVTGFAVAPFVGSIPYPYPFRIEPGEIEALIEAPFSFLAAPEHCQRKTVFFQGGSRSVCSYRYGDHEIWGATAEMIHGLITRMINGDGENL